MRIEPAATACGCPLDLEAALSGREATSQASVFGRRMGERISAEAKRATTLP